MATTYREGGIVEVDKEHVPLPGDFLKEDESPDSSDAPDDQASDKKPKSKAKAKK